MAPKMVASGFRGPSLAINELLLTFMCINNGISAFWRRLGALLRSQTGVFLPPVKTVGLEFEYSAAQAKANIET